MQKRLTLFLFAILLIASCNRYYIKEAKEKLIVRVCLYKNPKKIKVYTKEKSYKLVLKRIPQKRKIYLPTYSKNLTNINNVFYRGRVFAYKTRENTYIINEVFLEDYLKGVVPKEMPYKWPMEALKAQSVAARTYAYYIYRNNRYKLCHLTNTVKHQVYGGYSAEKYRTNRAIKETEGEILTYEGKPIISYFHSVCGDKILPPQKVWKNLGNIKYPYYREMPCRFTEGAKYAHWEIKIKRKKLCYRLTRKRKCSIKVIRDDDGIARKIIIKTKRKKKKLTLNDFRKEIGFAKIRSSFFNIYPIEKYFVFEGKGWGHSVGMCQWCAKNMAEKGYSYKEILEYFYPNTEITNIYGERLFARGF